MAVPLADGKSALRRQLMLGAVGAALTGGSAFAQAPAPSPSSTVGDFPNRPIRMVVTFPPGGSADAVVRLMVPRLNEKLGQPLVGKVTIMRMGLFGKSPTVEDGDGAGACAKAEPPVNAAPTAASMSCLRSTLFPSARSTAIKAP